MSSASLTLPARATLLLTCGLLIAAGNLARAGERNQVDYWHVGSATEVQLLRRLAARFAQQTGIHVHIQPIPWGHFQTKYFTAMASGNPPDAGSTNLSGPADFGKSGGLIDLQARFPAAIAQLKRSIFAEVWNTCSLEGHLYGVPYNATALIGFYRKDIFARLGLQPPQTWSELIRVIEHLNAAGYRYGFIWTRNDAWALDTYTRPFGVKRYLRDGIRVNWTDPGFVDGTRFAIQLWNNYDLVSEKPVELFSLPDSPQTLPMYFNYVLDYMEILVRAPYLRDRLGIFPFPGRDGQTPMTVMGGRTVVVFRRGRNPAGAMRWIQYLLSKEAQLLQFRALRNLGERSQLALSINRAFWQEDLGLRRGDQQLLHQVYRHLYSFPSHPWTREADQLLDQVLQRAEFAIRRKLAAVAEAHQLSVAQLKQRLAAGTLPQQKEQLGAFVADTTRSLLTEAAPHAQAVLDRDLADYRRNRAHDAPTAAIASRSWDVLDVAEIGMALLLVLVIVMVLAQPQMRTRWYAYVYVAPAVLSALVFIFVPMVVSLYLSFTRYNPVVALSRARWVGLANYALVLTDPVLWQSLWRSCYFVLIVLPIQLVLSVVLAACLDRKLWPDRLYKFVYFAPLVTSVISVALIWFAMLAGTNYGWANALLLKLGIVTDPIHFLEDQRFFLESVITLSIWQGLAFFILIVLAGLQSVPRAQYEAAAMDGAGPLRQFLHVSLPNLKPQIVFLTVMGTIGAVQVFEQIYMLGGGSGESGSKFGPNDSGMTMVPFIYRTGFEFLKMGKASAIAYVLFVVLLALTAFNLRVLTRKER